MLRALAFCAGLVFAASEVEQLNQRGSRYLNEGKFEQALEQFRGAARLQPGNRNIQFNIGLTLFRLGRVREALEPLAVAAQAPGLRSEAEYLSGAALYQLGELGGAAMRLEKVRDDAAHAESALYMLVECYRRLGKAAESQRAFQALSARYPDSAYLHRLLGVAYEAQNQPDEALREFHEVLRVNPTMPEARFAIGFIHLKQRRYDQARKWLEAELESQPCYAAANYYLGQILEKQNAPSAAGRYEKAIECDPGYVDAYVALGRVREQQQRVAEALNLYEHAVKRAPESAGAQYRLARLLQRLGREEDARKVFRKVTELNAAAARRDLERFGMGEETRSLESVLK